MTRFAIDDAAWANRWRCRPTAEKTVLTAGLATVALSSPGPLGGAAVVATTSVAACAVAGVPMRTWLVAMSVPTASILLGVVGIMVTFDDSNIAQLWSWGPLAVTEESALRAAQVAVRSVATTSAVILLATTTPMPYLLGSLGRVRGFGILAEIANLVYRMIFALLETQARIRESQASRLGYHSGRAARRSFGMLAAAIFVRAWTGAQRLEAGLQGRGYDGSTIGLQQRRPVSVAFVVVALVCTLGCGVASRLGPPWPR